MVLKKKSVLLRAAPLWKRFLAIVVDLLVLEFSVFSHFEKIVQSLAPVSAALTSSQFTQLSFVIGILGILVFFYFTILECAFGQTIGHMATNISLSMEKFSCWRIAVSNITFLPFFPFVFLWIIDLLTLLLSSNHQRFMHTAMGIQVVEVYTLEYGVTNKWN